MKDYVHRLDNFDGPAVGEIAVGYEMFDEAFEIYKKFGLKTQAIKVLLDHHEDLDRALEYALKVRCSPALTSIIYPSAFCATLSHSTQCLCCELATTDMDSARRRRIDELQGTV